MKNLDNLSPMTVSQYLLDLEKQLSADLSLEQFQLLNDVAINSLQGSDIEHQQVKTFNALVYECRNEKTDFICRYLLQHIVLQSKYALYGLTVHLANRRLNSRKHGQTEINELLSNYIRHTHEDLFGFSLRSGWSRVPKTKQQDIEKIIFDIMLKAAGGVLFVASFRYGGCASASGTHKIKQHYGITKHIYKEKLLTELQEGISLQGKTKAKPFVAHKGVHAREGYINVKYNIVPAKKVGKIPVPMHLKVDITKGLVLESSEGGKGVLLVDKKDLVKRGKIAGRIAFAGFFTFLFVGGLAGAANMQIYEAGGLILSDLEKLSIFFRGFFSPILPWVADSPESVKQYLKEKAIAEQLVKQGTKFLEKFPQLDVYFIGLGQLSEDKNGVKKLMSGFSYVNFEQERPELGEEYYLPSLESKLPQKRKKYYQKSRRTPTPVSSDTELVCAPEFDETREEVGSSLNDKALYRCKEGFALRNKTRAANLPVNVYFDLRLTNKGEVIGSQKDTNIVDASQIPGSSLYYDGNRITTKTSDAQIAEIETNNMNIFLGRAKLVDIVDFSLSSPIDYIATKGGVGSGAGLRDRLMNVPKALLSPDTYVYSQLLEFHQYDIELVNGAIDIDLLAAENVNLKFKLSLNDLLTRIVINQEEARLSSFHVAFNSSFVKLVITVGEMEITLHLLKSAAVILSDTQGNQIFFQANAPDSFLVQERITENVSYEEKLQACHAYQQHTLEGKQLACLMVNINETETEVIEDIFFIDEGGQGWSFIADTEGQGVDLIPFYGKGAYSLIASELEKNPSLAISFPVENINYYKDRNDLVLVRRGYGFTDFLLRLKNYYADPSLWKSLRLINLGAEALFNCDAGEHCLSGQALEDNSREAISLEDEIKAREKQLFTYYSLMPETNVASQTIYHNQQLSDSGEWQTVAANEERLGYLKVGFNPTDIQVRAEGSDLIFHIQTVLVGNHAFEFRFKNWDNASNHRIEGLIFPGYSSDNLSGFLSEDAALVERCLKKAIMKAKAYDRAKQLLSPLQLARLQGLLIDKLFATPWPPLVTKKTIIAYSLGFQDEADLINFYFIYMVSQEKNSAFKLFNSEVALQKTTQALYWLAVHTCLVSSDLTMVNKLFSMFASLETFMSPNRSFCQQVYASIGTPSSSSIEQIIQAEITPECLEGVKNWLMEASSVKIHYQPKPIVTEAGLYGFKLYPEDVNSESDSIYHSRENELGVERVGFIDLSDMPDIVEVHVSQEAEWFKFTFVSDSEFNYRPMLINWNDTNQRIEGIIKGEDIVTGLTALDDPASIEARINTALFSPERAEQVEEPRVGAQVHSAYREEESMLGDQPVNGIIQGESYATYSTEPPRIGVDSSSSSSSSGITNILGKVDVNGTLLATRYIIGNTDLPPTQNISPESKKEAYMEELMLTVEAAFKKEWEESESETSGGFWNNWLIGGLGAGVVGLIAGLVWWVKKGRSKNLSSNDVEKGTTLPLNSSNTNNAGNDEYSLNSIPPNERVPLFGEDEEGGDSEGSSSLSFNHWLAQANDCDIRIQPQEKTVKAYSEERVA